MTDGGSTEGIQTAWEVLSLQTTSYECLVHAGKGMAEAGSSGSSSLVLATRG